MAPNNLRVFVAAPRSGSTLFMRIIANCDDVAVTSRNVLMGLMKPRAHGQARRDFQPDYSIFCDPNHPIYAQAQKLGKQMVVSKEEFGNDRFTGTYDLNECNYDIFPDDESLLRTKPVFTFRNPLKVFDSWMARGWEDIESFFISYKALIRSFERARNLNSDTVFYTYDYITENKDRQIAVFQAICDYWGIKFDASILEFTSEFGQNFVYATEHEKAIYVEKNPKGIFNTIKGSRGIVSNVPDHGLLTGESRRRIAESGLVKTYEEIQELCRQFYSNINQLDNDTEHNLIDKPGIGQP